MTRGELKQIIDSAAPRIQNIVTHKVRRDLDENERMEHDARVAALEARVQALEARHTAPS